MNLARRYGARGRWIHLVLLNLVLAVVAVVPLWLLGYLLRHTLLAYVGWSEPDPTENDGALPLVLVTVPVIALSAGIWLLTNMALRPPVRGREWVVALACALLPGSMLLLVAPL